MFKLILFVGWGYYLALAGGAQTPGASASGGLPNPEVIARNLVAALPPPEAVAQRIAAALPSPELVAARVKESLDAAAAGGHP